ALIFSTKPNYFIGSMQVTSAPQPPTARQLINATKLAVGQLFTEADAETGIGRMQRGMEDNGYYESTIVPNYRYNQSNFLVDIVFDVDRGPHARIGTISVTGTPGYPLQKVMDIAKMHPGDRVTRARVTRALQRLRKHYQKNGRLEAQVA